MRIAGFLMLALAASTPAAAQVTFVGYWDPIYHEDFDERVPGPDAGDYAGLPITDAARMRADTWDASLLSVPEHQCKPHPSTYGFRGIGTLRIWEDRDPATQALATIETQIAWQSQHRYIWMDGRAAPREGAPHTWQGFSTGRFEGNQLVVTTDRLKAGWLRRNGLPLSDRATMVDRFIRHGNVLTHVMIVSDPTYLSEPVVKTNGFLYAENGTMIPYPCRPAVEIPRPKGTVPHHKMGENDASAEFAKKHALTLEAAQGGAQTALPEYAESLGKTRSAPQSPPRKKTEPSKLAVQPDVSRIEIQTLHVQDNIYLLSGDGGNTTVQVGEDGVLVVDTGLQAPADKLLAAIGKLANGKPIRFVINTHSHPDHFGGNEKIRMAGATIMGGNVVGDDPRGQQGATIIAHESVILAMSDPSGPAAAEQALWPTETFNEEGYDLFFNNEAVQLIHPPRAHTDGDTMVFFRKADVLSTGDVFVTTSYPVVDLQRGGSINGLIDTLNRIIDITVPRDKQEGGTLVIPGHGRVCDEADVVEYRDMVTIIRDRIQDMANAGMTLPQVQAAKPTADYDGRYGATQGFWTTEKFVEAVYRSLSAEKSGHAGS